MVETMMSDSRFQSQLASIMETLAKTAILEIGKLVEESHAVFRSEISRRRSENESLKNKCDLLESELRASRSAQQRAQTLESARPAAKEARHHPTIDSVFGKEWCMDLWKENGPAASQKSQSHVDPCMMEPSDLIDDGPEMMIIKDETYEDCPGKSKSQADLRSTEKGNPVCMESTVLQLYEESNLKMLRLYICTQNKVRPLTDYGTASDSDDSTWAVSKRSPRRDVTEELVKIQRTADESKNQHNSTADPDALAHTIQGPPGGHWA